MMSRQPARPMAAILTLLMVTLGPWVTVLAGPSDRPEPATVEFHHQGFTVTAPPEASQLEVRLMGPARTVIFAERTDGAAIRWTLSGTEADGDYRYEAVVVQSVAGEPAQRVRPGGFQVDGGRVVIPPAPDEPANAERGTD